MGDSQELNEKWRKRRERVDDAESQLVRRLEQTGELKHLYGHSLDSDDDPDWLVARVLKQQGFSHPVLEHAKELDELRRRADEPILRLRRRHSWLVDPNSHATMQQLQDFNSSRELKLAAYGENLRSINIAIRDYNLAVVEALRRPPIRVDDLVARVGREIPAFADTATSGRTRSRRWFRRGPLR